MKGLLGNFDGNSTNDFKAPNGDITPSNSVESVIYTFGKLCKLVFIACKCTPDNIFVVENLTFDFKVCLIIILLDLIRFLKSYYYL